jgi:hypothetical protein
VSKIRNLLSIFLACALALSSVTMAVARTHAQGVQDVVICSGYGMVTITLDAEGNPVGPVHMCPDCVPAVGALLPETGAPLTFSSASAPLALPAAAPEPARLAVLSFRARAPPLPV